LIERLSVFSLKQSPLRKCNWWYISDIFPIYNIPKIRSHAYYTICCKQNILEVALLIRRSPSKIHVYNTWKWDLSISGYITLFLPKTLNTSNHVILFWSFKKGTSMSKLENMDRDSKMGLRLYFNHLKKELECPNPPTWNVVINVWMRYILNKTLSRSWEIKQSISRKGSKTRSRRQKLENKDKELHLLLMNIIVDTRF
jgi:hypothetical protein